MTDQEYKEAKTSLCRRFSFCSDECPLYAYMHEQGIHACGALCEVLEFKDFEKAKEIMETYQKALTGSVPA